MKSNPESWNGLGFLNSMDTTKWDRMLYKIIRLDPIGWDARYSTVVEFVKVLKLNWFKTIPEMLKRLEKQDIGIDKFFQLERKITFKLSSLLKDVNILQKEILKEKKYDISKIANYTSHAFLPTVVYQLEEYGLPRMISKKIHNVRLINFYSNELTIHDAIELFNKIGKEKIITEAKLDDFDLYIIDYFFDGINTITPPNKV